MTAPSPHDQELRAHPDAPPVAWLERAPSIPYVRRLEDVGAVGGVRTSHIGPQVEGLLGHAPEAFVEDPELWTSSVHRDDLGRALAAWRRASETSGSYHLTYRMRARDGREVQVLDEAAPAEDPLTDERTWHGVVVDVTGDRPPGSDLREAEEKYRRLVERIPAVTYIDEVPEHDPTDLTPVYISPQIERLLGYTPEEWIRDPDLWNRVTHPDDAAAAEAGASRAFRDGTPLSIEYRMIARDGRTVWVREEASLFRDERDAPKFWQGVYIDITELKRADEMKNTFLQAVSHDLRTPLAAILGTALTLERDDLELTDAEVHDLAKRIAANSRKLDRMVADLLDLDRLSRGIIEPKLRDADIGALVCDIVEHVDVAADRSVILDCEPVTIPVDASKLERIVENLVANALRHTPPGATVWVRTRPHDGGGLVVVEDDGPGVLGELREAVFEPFRQGPSPSSHSPGVGIGLALVASFAELHHGRAWVEERPGGGASFHVFLPGRAVHR